MIYIAVALVAGAIGFWAGTKFAWLGIKRLLAEGALRAVPVRERAAK
jgi:hypothetical protein